MARCLLPVASIAEVLSRLLGRPTLVAAFEGFVTADRLLHLLAQAREPTQSFYPTPLSLCTQAIEDHGAALVVARAEEEERVRVSAFVTLPLFRLPAS